jgi:hypothetical protein
MPMRRVALGLALAAALAACQKQAPQAQYDPPAAPLAAPAAPAAPPAPVAYYAPPPSYSSTPYQDAHGDEDCTQDCSGHDAGYQWAEDRGIADEDDCTGNSESFIEGCRAYVRDQEEGTPDEHRDE